MADTEIVTEDFEPQTLDDIKDNPAFPMHDDEHWYFGMNRREYYALMLMPKVVEGYVSSDEAERKLQLRLAKKAVLAADCLMEVLWSTVCPACAAPEGPSTDLGKAPEAAAGDPSDAPRSPS